MALAIIRNTSEESWYHSCIGRVIDIDDKIYRKSSDGDFIIHNPHDINNTVYNNGVFINYGFWSKRLFCKVNSNLNKKNKNIYIPDKYKYVYYFDLKILSKKEERKYKLERLLNG